MFFKTRALAVTAFAAAMTLAAPAFAATYSFMNITGNNATDAAIGEAQMTVEVTDGSGAYTSGNCVSCVLFTFANAGPDAAVIMQTYWDDDSNGGTPGLLETPIFAFIDADDNGGDAGVDFSAGATPPNLPGGNTIGFLPDPAGALADSDTPQPVSKGVGVNESLGVVFGLIGNQTFNDVIAAMNAGELRVGIHVQAYDSGGSESFVTSGRCIQGTFECPDPVTGVPLPASLPLLLSGLLGAGFIARRRTRKSA